MNKKLKKILINIAKQKITKDDPSHDFEHALRVLAIAEQIAREEHADLDIIIPAALFHDIITHSKKDSRSKKSPYESAEFTKKILKKIKEYPKNKIEKVQLAICSCSFSNGKTPEFLESKIIQDADGLEATGAISIMRTFSSTGIMRRAFYHRMDPFCKKRTPDDLEYAIDLFFTRLLKIQDRMHTKFAQKIAKRRTYFLKKFIKELKLEFEDCCILKNKN